jgi:hypothetical protein
VSSPGDEKPVFGVLLHASTTVLARVTSHAFVFIRSSGTGRLGSSRGSRGLAQARYGVACILLSPLRDSTSS